MIAVRAISVAGLAAFAPAGAASAASPEAEGIGTVLLASDLSELCPETVRRRGPQEREDFIVEGMRVLISDGHRKRDLSRVPQVIPPEEMYAIIDSILEKRGVNPASQSDQCSFAGRVAGTKDRIGRFLERVD